MLITSLIWPGISYCNRKVIKETTQRFLNMFVFHSKNYYLNAWLISHGFSRFFFLYLWLDCSLFLSPCSVTEAFFFFFYFSNQALMCTCLIFHPERNVNLFLRSIQKEKKERKKETQKADRGSPVEKLDLNLNHIMSFTAWSIIQ